MNLKSFVIAAAAAAVAGLAVLPSAGAHFVPTTMTTPLTGTSIGAPAKNTSYFCPRTIMGISFPMTLKNPATPWVSGKTVNVAEATDVAVPGSVKMNQVFSIRKTATTRILKGNGIPNHTIGEYPVPSDSAAYAYYSVLPVQGYANAAEIPVKPYDMSLTVPRNPKVQSKPTCIGSLAIGISPQTGAAMHTEIAVDSDFTAVSPSAALPYDRCWGHPYATQYHYHGYTWKCFPNKGKDGEPSPLYAYAADGFGIYGPYSEGKRGTAVTGSTQKVITNAQLDECHGHYGTVKWDGKQKYMYHYHVNNEYPYSVGCFRGKVGKMSKVMAELGS